MFQFSFYGDAVAHAVREDEGEVFLAEGLGTLFQEGDFKVGGEGTDLDLNVALREPAFRLGDLGFVGDQEAYGAVIGQLFEDAVYKGLGDDEHLLVF